MADNFLFTGNESISQSFFADSHRLSRATPPDCTTFTVAEQDRAELRGSSSSFTTQADTLSTYPGDASFPSWFRVPQATLSSAPEQNQYANRSQVSRSWRLSSENAHTPYTQSSFASESWEHIRFRSSHDGNREFERDPNLDIPDLASSRGQWFLEV